MVSQVVSAIRVRILRRLRRPLAEPGNGLLKGRFGFIPRPQLSNAQPSAEQVLAVPSPQEVNSTRFSDRFLAETRGLWYKLDV